MSQAQGEGHPLRSRSKAVFSMIRTQYEVLQRDPRMLRLILVAILLLGAAYRFVGLDWGESTHLHPDERFLTMVTTSLDWPKNVAGYFNTATSPLNPHNRGHGFYVYGTFPVFLTKFVGGLVGKSGYDGVDVVGRSLSALFDLGGVLLIFLIGRRLYGRRQGLLASLLLALTALNIQNSHFYTVDNFTSFFVTLAFYFAVRVAQGEGWSSFLGLGVAYGFAVAGKVNSALFGVVIVAAGLLRIARILEERVPGVSNAIMAIRGVIGGISISLRVEPLDGQTAEETRGFTVVTRVALGLLCVLLVTLFVFRVVQPYAFQGPSPFSFKLAERYKDNMKEISGLASGERDYPPSHQWTDRTPWVFPWINIVKWGMGLPLGLTAWAGWLLAGYFLLWKRRREHLLPWLWTAFYFAYQGQQFTKNTRYFLFITPYLALFAAWLLVWLWDKAKALRRRHAGSWARYAPSVAGIIVVLVILGALFWATAYTSIYRRPLTRVEASRWIYANIPRGSTVANEVWDDPIPLRIDGKDGFGPGMYTGVDMQPYWEDTPEKLESLVGWLDQTDYIFLTSNRLYDSIPRLPMRFPMTTEYYRLLFAGELGFERVQTFASYPQLLGLVFNDDKAEESLTVYDHPKVIIFKKTADYSTERVRELLGDIPLDRLLRLRPKQVTAAKDGLMFSDEDWTAQREGGTWTEIFKRESLVNRIPVIVWLLLVLVLGWVTFPLAFVAFRGLSDRGYALSKTLGLLLLAWLSWMAASLKLQPYTRVTIGMALGLITLASAAIFWHSREEMWAFLKRQRWLIVLNELLFLAFFFAFLMVRNGNPDLWHPGMGGEKPMDFAYLNAIIKSTYFPPYDPWFAGGWINYYYYGLVVVATLIKLTGIVPWVAYNLALPLLFSLLATGVFCVTYNLIDRGKAGEATSLKKVWSQPAVRYGLLGAIFVAVLGNLAELQLILKGLQDMSGASLRSTVPGLEAAYKTVMGLYKALLKGQSLPFRNEWWYWNASRVMQAGEINEFPFFTFLYADLHAHLIALPFGVLVLGFVVAYLKRLPLSGKVVSTTGDAPASNNWKRFRVRLMEWISRVDWHDLLWLGLLSLALGELRVNNTWDYPTYLLLALAGLVIVYYAQGCALNWENIRALAFRCVGIVVLSTLFYWPFHAHFGSAYTSVGLWKGERTHLNHYLIIHGMFLFALGSFLVGEAFGRGTRNGPARLMRLAVQRWYAPGRLSSLYRALVRRPTGGYQLAWWGLAILGILSLVLWMKKLEIFAVMLPWLLLVILLFLRREQSPQKRFLFVMIGLGIALTLGVDLIVIKGDIGRMNSVFKFYLQVWVLWGIAAAVGLAKLAERRSRQTSGRWRCWQAVMIALIASAALYPICATPAKMRDRWLAEQESGLDGMAYMLVAPYQDQGRPLELRRDYEAINWLLDNVEGSPVILEGNTPNYHWGSRVSIYTGLPTVIGWDWHQKQQRMVVSGELVDWRIADVRTIYNTQDVDEALQLLRRYGVSYVYVGELEKAYYDAGGLAKFDDMIGTHLDVVYSNESVKIYQVRGEPGATSLAAPSPGEPREARGLGERILGRLGLVVYAEDRPGREPPSPPGRSSGEEVGPMLDSLVGDLPVIDDRGWNQLANSSSWVSILFWWTILEVLGLVAWPLAQRVFGRFRDGGYALAKTLGLLSAAYLLWIAASTRVLSNSPPVAYGALIAVGALSFFLQRQRREEMAALWRRSKSLILFEEVLFTVAFLSFVGLRLLNPDLWQPWFGGEKMMESAFLNAILKSAFFPPYDPYFSGGQINYYYYGQYLVAFLVKLTGIIPSVAFNLAIPTIFALTVSNAFSLGYNLVARRASDGVQRVSYVCGLAAVVFLAVMGNLSALLQVIEGFARVGGARFEGNVPSLADLSRVVPGVGQVLFQGRALPPFEYWYRATRIIPYTINEFPFFSFLFADLHPHMIGIPVTLLMLALLLQLALDERPSLRPPLALSIAIMVSLGAVATINTWDLPVYLALLAAVLLLRAFRRRRWWRALGALVTVALLAVGGLALYWPFFSNYQAMDVGLGLVTTRTTMPRFLDIWGFFLFMLASALTAYAIASPAHAGTIRWLRGAWRWRGALPRYLALTRLLTRKRVSVPLLLWFLITALLVIVFFTVLGEWVLFLLVAWLGAAVILLLTSTSQSVRERFVLLLILMSGLVILGCELIYVRDFLSGGDWQRMNTVFKFYIQAWVLLSIASAASIPAVWRWLRGHCSRLGRWAWGGACAVLLFGSLLYPVMAIPVRVNERFPGAQPPRGTLDGMAYMTVGVYTWPDPSHPIELSYDYDAIQWLLENVKGTPVILEASLAYYREGGMRVSSYTGLPTLAGAHQREQRPMGEVISREEDVKRLYETPDQTEALELIEKYDIEYIYLGQLERIAYSPQGLPKFQWMQDDGILQIVYQNSKVTIYQVNSLS